MPLKDKNRSSPGIDRCFPPFKIITSSPSLKLIARTILGLPGTSRQEDFSFKFGLDMELKAASNVRHCSQLSASLESR